jgi:cytochrome P450
VPPQSKLLAELSAAGLTTREFGWGDLARLPYLNAVIKETLRLFAPATVASCQEADRDMTIMGHHVPKVTTHWGW